jgi:hypothetical protein
VRSSSPRFYDPTRAFFHKLSMGNGCWEWLAQTDERGYGRVTVKGKKIFAHRFSYELFVGPAADLFVLHSCDNPSCVRPDHLRLGTHADNMADMRARGRAHRRPSPERCPAGHDDWVIRYPNDRSFRRVCQTCARKQSRESYARRKQAA